MKRLFTCILVGVMQLMSVNGQEGGPFGPCDETDLDKMTEAEKKAHFRALRPKQIRVQAEFIEISSELLTELRMDKDLAVDDDKLRDKLENLLDAKDANKAKMLESALLIAQPGEIARVESIEELIYPTEYEPAEIVTPEKGTATAENTDILPPNPTAFETRNVGLTLEVEPTLSEDQERVNLKFTPDLVYHTGDVSYLDWKDKGVKNAVKFPNFFTLTTDTRLTIADGKYRLAAVHSPKGAKGKIDRTRKVLCFVKVDVLVVE